MYFEIFLSRKKEEKKTPNTFKNAEIRFDAKLDSERAGQRLLNISIIDLGDKLGHLNVTVFFYLFFVI